MPQTQRSRYSHLSSSPQLLHNHDRDDASLEEWQTQPTQAPCHWPSAPTTTPIPLLSHSNTSFGHGVSGTMQGYLPRMNEITAASATTPQFLTAGFKRPLPGYSYARPGASAFGSAQSVPSLPKISLLLDQPNMSSQSSTKRRRLYNIQDTETHSTQFNTSTQFHTQSHGSTSREDDQEYEISRPFPSAMARPRRSTSTDVMDAIPAQSVSRAPSNYCTSTESQDSSETQDSDEEPGLRGNTRNTISRRAAPTRPPLSPPRSSRKREECNSLVDQAAEFIQNRSPSKRESIAKLLLQSDEFLQSQQLVRNRNNDIDWVATFLNLGFEGNSIYAIMCPLRKGRWKAEEERYALELLRLIGDGIIRLRHGVSMRSFIAKKLHSDDMRVLKKMSNFRMFKFAKMITPRMTEDEEFDMSQPGAPARADRLAKIKSEFLRSVQLEALIAVRKYLSDSSIRELLNRTHAQPGDQPHASAV